MPRQFLHRGMFSLALIGLLCTAGTLDAQAPPAANAELQTLRARIDDLTKQLAELRALVTSQNAEIAKLRADLTKNYNVLASQVAEQRQLVENTHKQLASQAADQKQLVEKLEKTHNELLSQVAEQKQILEAISTKDNTGRHIVNMYANMQSTDFQGAMRSAVHQSMDGFGIVEIENRLPMGYTISVNGSQYMVAGHSVQQVRVPVGTVVTELVGYEGPKHWTIAPPTYRQRIVIGPAPRVAYFGWSEWVWDPGLGAWVRRALP